MAGIVIIVGLAYTVEKVRQRRSVPSKGPEPSRESLQYKISWTPPSTQELDATAELDSRVRAEVEAEVEV